MWDREEVICLKFVVYTVEFNAKQTHIPGYRRDRRRVTTHARAGELADRTPAEESGPQPGPDVSNRPPERPLQSKRVSASSVGANPPGP